MDFEQELEQGYLIKRYKRFLADVCLPNGDEITIHCPNTGSMKNCCPDGAPVWFSTSDNPKRKYPNTWEIVQSPEGHKIAINSAQANKIVVEALNAGGVSELTGFSELKTEVKYGEEGSRIDILLSDENNVLTYIEVKSLTLLEDDGRGYFPDAVSARGQKHLRELMHMVELGHRAVLLFCVQHTGIQSVSPAWHIDPEYSELVEQAIEAGVEVLAYGCSIDSRAITLNQALPFSVR